MEEQEQNVQRKKAAVKTNSDKGLNEAVEPSKDEAPGEKATGGGVWDEDEEISDEEDNEGLTEWK